MRIGLRVLAALFGLVWSPDGQRLAVASSTGIAVWDHWPPPEQSDEKPASATP